MEYKAGSAMRAKVEMPGGGHCLMSGFPGLETGIDGSGYIDPDALQDTLQDIRDNAAALMLVLPEEEELPEGSFGLLKKEAETRGIELIFLPIEDFMVPDAAFMARWQSLGPRLHDLLRGGAGCAICCQYGAGRSGLMVALLLIEDGMGAEAAVAHVRAVFPEAVESAAQLAWLEERAAARGTAAGN